MLLIFRHRAWLYITASDELELTTFEEFDAGLAKSERSE